MKFGQMRPLVSMATDSRVGQSKPPPVLTCGFNRLKPPWSILPKVVNTPKSGQYKSEWSIGNFKCFFLFCGGLIYVFFRFLFVHILQKEKNELFRPCQGYSSGGLWLGRCLVIDICLLHRCRWFRCCVSNLITGSFHRLRLGFIFDEFRTLKSLLTVCS